MKNKCHLGESDESAIDVIEMLREELNAKEKQYHGHQSLNYPVLGEVSLDS